MKVLLVYCQDPGGASFLFPVLKKLKNEICSDTKIKLLCHPLSENIILDHFFEFELIEPQAFPLSVYQWEKILNGNSINYVVSTLSSNKYDLSNANLIHAAKKNQIFSLGFLDHWKGFDRLLNNKNKPLYCPDWLGVIDEHCVEKLKKQNINACFNAVGHPVLEGLINRSKSNKSTNKILFVSQPNTNQNSYDSLFLKSNILNILVGITNKCLPNYDLYYRPHPKENTNNFINPLMTIDITDKSELFSKYDFFIGFDSMLLIEAHFFGAKVISVRFPDLIESFEDEIPYNYALNANNLSEFEKALKGKINNKIKIDPFINSSDKCLHLIKSFCEFY